MYQNHIQADITCFSIALQTLPERDTHFGKKPHLDSCIEMNLPRLISKKGTGHDRELPIHVDYAIFTPNPDRLDHIREMAAACKADSVIHYGLQFCQPNLMEATPVEKALEEKNIPCLRIEIDYSMEDIGQLKTRTVLIPENPQFIGAFGAALLAADMN